MSNEAEGSSECGSSQNDGETPESAPKLLTGDPAPQCATFSRFVLPFPYRLQHTAAVEPKAGPPNFAEAQTEDWLHSPLAKRPKADVISPKDRERRDYLTRETSENLFGRARWFVLRGMEELNFQLDRKDIGADAGPEVVMQPPALVLFEMPPQPATDEKTEEEVDEVLQVGFLVVELFFKDKTHATLDNLARLNEEFRYWLRPYADHSHPETDYRQCLGDLLRKAVMPQAGQASQQEQKASAERTLYLKRWASFLQCPVQMDSGECFKLMPDKWIEDAEAWACGHTGPNQSHGWLAHADYRTFVWSCAVVEESADLLTAIKKLAGSDDEMERAQKILPSELGAWAKFLNVDRTLTDADEQTENLRKNNSVTPFNRRWAAERTYMRWAHTGALQGFCQHAGVMLTGLCEKSPTWRHFGAMYFDQALLLLYNREVLFRFSYRLSRYSQTAEDLANSDKTKEEFGAKFKHLRAQFTRFTNMYQFPLLSNQQQALELYQMLRENLGVLPLFGEVKEEVETTDEFLTAWLQNQTQIGQIKMAKEEGKIAKATLRLTVVATVGLIITFALDYLAADPLISGRLVLPWSKEFIWPGWQFWVAVLLLFGVALCFMAGLLFFSDWLHKQIETICECRARRRNKAPNGNSHPPNID